MTHREFYLAIVNEEITDEIKEAAQTYLKQLDEKNEKRRNDVSSKKAKENAPIIEKIKATLANASEPVLASAIAAECNVSTSKASALLAKMVEAGEVDKIEKKVKGVGKRFAYSFVAEE